MNLKNLVMLCALTSSIAVSSAAHQLTGAHKENLDESVRPQDDF